MKRVNLKSEIIDGKLVFTAEKANEVSLRCKASKILLRNMFLARYVIKKHKTAHKSGNLRGVDFSEASRKLHEQGKN